MLPWGKLVHHRTRASVPLRHYRPSTQQETHPLQASTPPSIASNESPDTEPEYILTIDLRDQVYAPSPNRPGRLKEPTSMDNAGHLHQNHNDDTTQAIAITTTTRSPTFARRPQRALPR